MSEDGPLNTPIFAALICAALTLIAGIACADSAVLGSQQVMGDKKLCSYNYIGGPYVLTIKAYQSCPMTIHTNMLAALTIGPADPEHPANQKH